jgi:hypothetical protein
MKLFREFVVVQRESTFSAFLRMAGEGEVFEPASRSALRSPCLQITVSRCQCIRGLRDISIVLRVAFKDKGRRES